MRYLHAFSRVMLAWLLLCGGLGAASPDPAAAGEADAAVSPLRPAGYPVPPADERRLFYLQRSSNSNTVVYDANLVAPGRLDPERPIDVYWLRYNSTGERKRLSFAERSFAYGVSVAPAEATPGGFLARVVALPQRPFRVFIDEAGKIQAIMELDGRPVRLESVYLELAGGGLLPDVRHIEVFGVELATGRPIHERIIP